MCEKHLKYTQVEEILSAKDRYELIPILSEAVCFIVENGLEDKLRMERDGINFSFSGREVTHTRVKDTVDECKKKAQIAPTKWKVTT